VSVLTDFQIEVARLFSPVAPGVVRGNVLGHGAVQRSAAAIRSGGGLRTGLWSRTALRNEHNASMTTDSGPQDFEGATFFNTSFKGATMRACDLSGVTMRSADVDGLDIDGHDLLFGSLLVNGVDVVPLVDAELNRQFPGRELQNAQTPEGLRDGWVAVQAAWATTVADTPPDMVDAHVDDEWSLAQTLRHLVLATDAWLRGGIMGIEQPFHEIGQIFTGAPEMGFDMSIFRIDPPKFEEILEVRAERQQMVTDFLARATPELLVEERNNPWGGGDWHPTAGDCVRVILEEEWAHLRYIRRDLALLA
jgi:DinB superfamily/Pentapeptide repeats (8 copies)